jgi:ParB family transcriptional regulator, chromosome partitioning protein
VTPAVVRQRLKLATVSPKLLVLYEQDAMTLEMLMAFALSSDHARQEQVWEAIQAQRYLQSAHQIRRLLTENTVRANDSSALFVGLEAYEAAGGFVMRDLFADDNGGYLTDPLLLQTLVNAKLEAEAAKVRAEGWKWVEAYEDVPYNATYGLRPLIPVTPALTDAEEEELEALVSERDELDNAREGDDKANPDISKRIELVSQRIKELDAKTPVFAQEDMAIGGCFLSFDSEGVLCVERGFVRPEDDTQAPSGDADADGAAAAGDSDDAAGWKHDSVVTQVDERDDDSAALPEKLIADLTTFRTLALRDALANDSDTALLALLHALTLQLIYPHGRSTCLEITATGMLANNLKDARQTRPAQSIEARTNSWKKALPKTAEELWDFLVGLGQEERQALLAQLVSMTVNAVVEPRNPGRGRIRHADQLAGMLNLDLVHAGFRPTVENYLGRVTKAEIMAAVTEACGEETASLLADLKKKEMAAEAERLLANTGWLPAPLRGPRIKDSGADGAGGLGEAANDDALPAFLAAEDAAAA